MTLQVYQDSRVRSRMSGDPSVDLKRLPWQRDRGTDGPTLRSS